MGSSDIRDIRLDEVVCLPPDPPESMDRVVLPVDKPHGWTSFDVLRRLKRVLDVRKMGHAGTLDPLATGLLIVLAGRATRLQDRFLNLDKEYEGVMRLGEVTPSFDSETEVVQRIDWTIVSDDVLDAVRSEFVGSIVQQTPAYSAVKVGGERLYKKARRGEDVVAPSRVVTIEEFTLTDRDGPDVSFRVRCSKGTYIRSLVHELGMALEVGAHLIALRRTAIGEFSVDDAWQISEIESSVAGHLEEG